MIFVGHADEYVKAWIKSHRPTPVGPTVGWDKFDLSKSTYVASASLLGTGSTWCSTERINTSSIIVLPDGNLSIAAQAQGHQFIWEFDDGHAFEVSHLKSTYSDKSAAVGGYLASAMSKDGTKYVYCSGDSIFFGNNSTAYKQSTRGSYYTFNFTYPYNGSWYVAGNIRDIKFGLDGKKFYAVSSSTGFIGQYSLSTAYDLSTRSRDTGTIVGGYTTSTVPSDRIVPAGITDAINWWATTGNPSTAFIAESFSLSPDSTHVVIRYPGAVVKYKMSTPGDMTTLVFENALNLIPTISPIITYPLYTIQAVAITDDGSKMIVTTNNAANNRVFAEFDLH